MAEPDDRAEEESDDAPAERTTVDASILRRFLEAKAKDDAAALGAAEDELNALVTPENTEPSVAVGAPLAAENDAPAEDPAVDEPPVDDPPAGDPPVDELPTDDPILDEPVADDPIADDVGTLGPAFDTPDYSDTDPHRASTLILPDAPNTSESEPEPALEPLHARAPVLATEEPTSNKPGPIIADPTPAVPELKNSHSMVDWASQPAMPSMPVARPKPVVDPVREAWAALDEQPANAWKTSTGESRVESITSGFDPEYSRKKTNIFALGAEVEAAEGARLVALGGADEGKEFALKRQVTVGRSVSCEIVLAEVSVSREHARVFREKDTYFVLDKKSGNGTFVNGARINTKVKLASGDEISFGKARFRFLELGDVFKPVDDSGAAVLPGAPEAPVPTESHRTIVVATAILTVTLCLAAGVLGARRSSSMSKADVAFGYYMTGIEAFKARDWGKAEEQFAVYLGFDPKSARGKDYLEAVAREKANGVQLASAKVSAAKGDLQAAYTQVSAIGDSVYAEEAAQLRQKLDTTLDGQLAQAKQLLTAGRAQDAQEILARVQSIRPGQPEVVTLLAQAQSALSKGRAGQANERTARRHPSNKALQKFSAGQLDEAMTELRALPEDSTTVTLIGKIETFRRVYDSALVEHRAKRTDSALKLLESALDLEARVGNGPSRVKDEIKRKMADMLYVQGIDAQLAKKPEVARARFAEALARDPGHAASQKKLQELGK